MKSCLHCTQGHKGGPVRFVRGLGTSAASLAMKTARPDPAAQGRPARTTRVGLPRSSPIPIGCLLEAKILEQGPETIAAFIGEPVLGTGGLIPPPDGYWAAIQTVLKKYDILLIADEVVTGFGRLGSAFGSTHYGIEPDIISIAKGLTSAYAPLSGSIISERVWKVPKDGTDEYGPIGHGWTYSAHPVCAAAGVANVALIDGLDLVNNARSTGACLNNAMKDALGNHPHVGDIRGEGMLCAVELMEQRDELRFFDPARKIGPAVVAARLRRGIIARAMPQGNIIGFAPPLCLSEKEADLVVAATHNSVDEVFGK